MVEQTLQPVTKGQYNNFELKSRLHKGIKGIDDGSFIIVEKIFPEGRETISSKLKDFKGNPVVSYSCKVKHNGVEGTFWLNANEHEEYAQCGGVGDRVKIALTKESKVDNKGVERLIQKLSFTKVE